MAGMLMTGSELTAQTMQGRQRPSVASTNGNNNVGSRRPDVSGVGKNSGNAEGNRSGGGTMQGHSGGTTRGGGTMQGGGNTHGSSTAHSGNTHAIPKPAVTIPGGNKNGDRKHDWSRPMAPPAREYRPVVHNAYRPVMPSAYRPMAGAPVIDRILGLRFGSYYSSGLDYLYTNGYHIDGWYGGTIYLRDVSMLGTLWTDVMLGYDNCNRLDNAQFFFSTAFSDRSRYNSVYRDLCYTYGTPVSQSRAGFEASVTWWGGSATGYITLAYYIDNGRFYTTLTVGC